MRSVLHVQHFPGDKSLAVALVRCRKLIRLDLQVQQIKKTAKFNCRMCQAVQCVNKASLPYECALNH